MRSLILLALLATPATARPHVTADLDAETLGLSGFSATFGIEPMPHWRFALALASHDLPDAQSHLSSNNDSVYITMPVAVEAIARYRLDNGLVLGGRAGMVHLHVTRIGTFGINEQFDYGLTPFVGYEWQPHPNFYVQPWFGVMLALFSMPHGELPMEETAPDYSTWPTRLRGGITLGARY